MSKAVLGLFLLIFLLTISGCQTAKNTAIGLGVIGKGIADDAHNTWEAIQKADDWVKENYW